MICVLRNDWHAGTKEDEYPQGFLIFQRRVSVAASHQYLRVYPVLSSESVDPHMNINICSSSALDTGQGTVDRGEGIK